MNNFRAKKPYDSVRGTLDEDKMEEHLEMFGNRVAKNFKKLNRGFRKKNIEVFRIYDWDIPEIRIVVDWYNGHLVVAEYKRTQTDVIENWLQRMAAAAAQKLDLPSENIHLKTRKTGGRKPGHRYEREKNEDQLHKVREGPLKFLVNLDDYIDTGLFSDHRVTRQIVQGLTHEKSFLNLFAYTGSFTCAAVLGGARQSTTVDLSNTYLAWAEKNFALNDLPNRNHEFVKSDCLDYLHKAKSDGRQWDICLLDPPSFSTRFGTGRKFDVVRDHPEMLKLALNVISKNGILLFSTNHQRFVPDFDDLKCRDVEEITAQTVPVDYRNKQIHRCWKIYR
ncbi:MAG: class I SAM-dependent methyltransferase [Myxococcota bacterium]|nr:class I SAM-dependent methyltransferase [Myxococcota bacterium]